MKDYKLIIFSVIAAVVFIVLLRRGAFLKISGYIEETKEELRKCTWPTWDELKGSTALVMIAIAVLGGFTVAIDFLIASFVRWIV